MKQIAVALILLGLPAAGYAQSCPAAADHVADIDALIAQTQAATSQADARAVSGRMWELWTDAPDALLDSHISSDPISELD